MMQKYRKSIVERLLEPLIKKPPVADEWSPALGKIQSKLPKAKHLKGTLVSSSSSPKVEGNFLYINAIYDKFSSNASDEELLTSYRHDAKLILEELSKASLRQPILAVCISFYEIPKEGQNIRVFRTTIERKHLGENALLDDEIVRNEFSAHPRLFDKYKAKYAQSKRESI